MSQTPTVGSRSLTGKRNHGLGWLPWAALALLARLALLAFLIIRNVADDGDDAGLGTRNDPAAASLAGQQVQGRATVESVVADEAFWVGSPGHRVLVFLTPQASTRPASRPSRCRPVRRST